MSPEPVASVGRSVRKRLQTSANAFDPKLSADRLAQRLLCRGLTSPVIILSARVDTFCVSSKESVLRRDVARDLVRLGIRAQKSEGVEVDKLALLVDPHTGHEIKDSLEAMGQLSEQSENFDPGKSAVQIQIGELVFQVKPGVDQYRWMLQNPLFNVLLNPKKAAKRGCLQWILRPESIATHGLEAANRMAQETVAELVGPPGMQDLQVSRCDIQVTFIPNPQWRPSKWDTDNFSTHAEEKNTHSTIDPTEGRGRPAPKRRRRRKEGMPDSITYDERSVVCHTRKKPDNGYQIGKLSAGVELGAYDKTEERVRKNGGFDAFLVEEFTHNAKKQGLEAIPPSMLDRKSPVGDHAWRIEIRFGREAIAGFRVQWTTRGNARLFESVDDVIRAVPNLWSYGLNKWCRLTVPSQNPDVQLSRRAMHPVWQYLADAPLGIDAMPGCPQLGEVLGLDLRRVHRNIASIQTLAPMSIGIDMQFGAAIGEENILKAQEALVDEQTGEVPSIPEVIARIRTAVSENYMEQQGAADVAVDLLQGVAKAEAEHGVVLKRPGKSIGIVRLVAESFVRDDEWLDQQFLQRIRKSKADGVKRKLEILRKEFGGLKGWAGLDAASRTNLRRQLATFEFKKDEFRHGVERHARMETRMVPVEDPFTDCERTRSLRKQEEEAFRREVCKIVWLEFKDWYRIEPTALDREWVKQQQGEKRKFDLCLDRRILRQIAKDAAVA